MSLSSHITNIRATDFVRTSRADFYRDRSYNPNMARRGIPKGYIRWYLREWMANAGLSGRGAQARMMELTGWSKATMSQLYKGEQDFNPKVLYEAALALHAEPWELLMPPANAMDLRGFRETARAVAKIDQDLAERTGTNG